MERSIRCRARWYARNMAQGLIKRPNRALVELYGLQGLVQQYGLHYFVATDLAERRRRAAYAWQLKKGRLKTANPELVQQYSLQGLIEEIGVPVRSG